VYVLSILFFTFVVYCIKSLSFIVDIIGIISLNVDVEYCLNDIHVIVHNIVISYCCPSCIIFQCLVLFLVLSIVLNYYILFIFLYIVL
jgi:hypothetical protein